MVTIVQLILELSYTVVAGGGGTGTANPGSSWGGGGGGAGGFRLSNSTLNAYSLHNFSPLCA